MDNKQGYIGQKVIMWKDIFNQTAETETKVELNDMTSSYEPATSTFMSDQLEMQTPEERQGECVDSIAKYECDQCDKIYSGYQGLYAHKKSVHQGVKYACDQCNYQATKQSHLIRHIQSKHEGVEYACDQCNYKATWKTTLNSHKRANHQ